MYRCKSRPVLPVIAHDYVLDEMVVGLGGSVAVELAPFEPEAGAYQSQAGAGITIIIMITNMVTTMIICMLTSCSQCKDRRADAWFLKHHKQLINK